MNSHRLEEHISKRETPPGRWWPAALYGMNFVLIIAFPNNSVYEEDVVARTAVLIGRLVHEGKISEARIDVSYRRIQRLKRRLLAANLSAKINRE